MLSGLCLVKKASLTEETAQLVTYLQKPSHKNALGYWYKPSTEKTEPGGYLGLTDRPASSTGQALG